MTSTTNPPAETKPRITYDVQGDVAQVWLKGGADPGEASNVTTYDGALCVHCDDTGHVILIEFPGPWLHPDCCQHAGKMWPVGDLLHDSGSGEAV